MATLSDYTNNYYKELEHLTIAELYCYAISIGITKPKQNQRKDQIVRRILEKQPRFLDNVSEKFYFTQITKDRRETLEYIAIPDDPTTFVHLTQRSGSIMDIEKIQIMTEYLLKNQ